MMTYLPQFLPRFVEMVADMSSLHHQIDQAFPNFSRMHLKTYERPAYEAKSVWLHGDLETNDNTPSQGLITLLAHAIGSGERACNGISRLTHIDGEILNVKHFCSCT